jgi:hypothetical protein
MTNYANLVAAWNSATQPPAGVTGAGLSAGDTTAQKLAKINAWTVTGSVPTSFYTTGAALWNCVKVSEFLALSATGQAQIQNCCMISGPLLGGSANAAIGAPGLFLNWFALNSVTIANLTALAQAVVQDWWQYAGFTSAFGYPDLLAAASANNGVPLT